ncbi:MAG: response regulator transcription factor [Bacteroidetes bacterium]|nr:response regulator transcription factor [Bacteroidota bacterium]
MMHAVVVDDEPHVRSAMVELMNRYCAGVEVVGTADSVASAIEVVRASDPDIVFLDIEMPERNGFELLAAFTPIPFKVVFVTAYDHYAIRAIKLSALDYLLKPVNPFELQAAVAKAGTMVNGIEPGQIELMNDHAHGRTLSRIVIPTEKGFVVLPVEDIVRCGSASNYTSLHLRDGTHVVSSRTLGDYEELFLDAGFCRVHHSHLINMRHVLRYHKGKGGVVVMSDGSEVEVSTRRRDTFLESIRRI